MTALEYRSDDVLGQGYCPRCHRTITIDTALYGHCQEHGKVPADFTRPAGWADPDDDPLAFDEGAECQHAARELGEAHDD